MFFRLLAISLCLYATPRGAVADPPAVLAARSADCRPFAKPRHDLKDLPNFANVSDALYRGAQPTPDGFRKLKAMGVKTVVNLRSFSSDRGELKGTGLRYAHVYCKPWHPEDEDTVKFLKIMSDRANHPVFVHCQQGADRTGQMVAVYRMVEQGWAPEEAMREMQAFGFHDVWAGIARYVERFDEEAFREKLADAKPPRVVVVE